MITFEWIKWDQSSSDEIKYDWIIPYETNWDQNRLKLMASYEIR